MTPLTHLWLPVLLSAVAVFIVSSIIHVVLKPWHAVDYLGLSNEDEVRATMRKGTPAPGMYMLPYCKMEDMKKPESQEKFKQGPVGFMILRANGTPNMGKNLVLWFIFCLIVGLFSAYVAASTLAAGTAGMQVFRVVSTVGFMAYAFGSLPMGIWYAQPWKAVTKDVIDGLIYALVTGWIFVLLWPK
ncbi:MAG: hypothetical protein KGL13_02785 [Gammaproteobacteria bacterium]|nr:hypothetical protein [Gammaproteobacteria bacterium]MDE2345373.1 hypothetical protein [Gammaproteobacteria bacterium]